MLVVLLVLLLFVLVLHDHEVVLQDLLGGDAAIWAHAQHLVEQVNELAVAGPFVSLEVVPFLYTGKKTGQSSLHELILLLHYLRIVPPSDAEEAVVNSAVAVHLHHSAFQGEPQRESAQHFKQDGAEGPDVEDEGESRVVLDADVGLLRESLGKETLDFWWQVFWRALSELSLVFDDHAFGVKKEARAEIDHFETANCLRIRVIINDDVVRLQVAMDDAKSSKEAQSSAHPEQEVLQQVEVRADAVVEAAVMDHVNSFALVKLAFHVEEMLVHSPSFAELIDQPQVLLVFD